MRRQQRSEVPVQTGDKADGMGVGQLVEAEPAVLLRDLDSEGAHLPQAGDVLPRDLPVAVDGIAVHFVPHEGRELFHERP